MAKIRRRHGFCHKRVYKIWSTMIHRTTNPKAGKWKRYGGRGITTCEEWRNPVNFVTWALANGYSDDLQIDRIDNDGPYAPDNCRWVTARKNSNNRSNNRTITAFGETKTIAEWSRDPRITVKAQVLYDRIGRLGWSPEDAIMAPKLTSWNRR